MISFEGDKMNALRPNDSLSFTFYVAKSYFETYKSYDHMQNFRPLSQKFSEISRFEKLRICLNFTHTEIAITRSFFKIESSSFGFSLIF